MSLLHQLKLIEKRLGKIEQVNKNIAVSGKFSSLESDLVKEHLRSLYDLYNELENTPKAQIQEEVEPIKKELPKIEEIKETPQVEIEQPVNVVIEKPIEIVTEEVLIPKVEQIEVNIKKETKKVSESNIEDEENEPVSLFEKYQSSSDKVELNKRSHHTKPLKQLITLNDKFILKKELFDNNAAKYEECLNRVDALESKSEAFRYFEANVWNTSELREKEEVIERVGSILDLKFGA